MIYTFSMEFSILENESGLTRISVYNRRGTNVIDVPVPDWSKIFQSVCLI